jgi:predicted alpha/beta-fold hydrolase
MILSSQYQSSFPYSDGHLETLVPYLLRRMPAPGYLRERINTDDGDFLDLDWLRSGHQRLTVLSHGLEGRSHSTYMVGMAKALLARGSDVLAWNNRGCSGETNRLLAMYHSGASFDLRRVLQHVLQKYEYQEIFLVGFSMGGNITLKYLGEEAEGIDPRIRKAVAISVPVSLRDCAEALGEGVSSVYTRQFILRMTRKLRIKKRQFPDFNPNLLQLARLSHFKDFDDRITAPINDFANAYDYWEKCSSLNFLPMIRTKTLIINAKNDPFLKGLCYPYAEVEGHPFVDLETPERGGHVGFVSEGLFRQVWTESRVPEFFKF